MFNFFRSIGFSGGIDSNLMAYCTDGVMHSKLESFSVVGRESHIVFGSGRSGTGLQELPELGTEQSNYIIEHEEVEIDYENGLCGSGCSGIGFKFS